jgi:hypothetical protein
LLPIIGSKGSKFNKKVKEAQEVARINYFGTSQLKYKLRVEAVSLYFKSSNIGKLFPISGMVIFPHVAIMMISAAFVGRTVRFLLPFVIIGYGAILRKQRHRSLFWCQSLLV